MKMVVGHYITCEEDPLDRSASENVLIVDDEVDFLPHIAEEVINIMLAEIGGAVEPIRAENSDGEMQNLTFLARRIGIESVDVGGAIVPFQVVFENS